MRNSIGPIPIRTYGGDQAWIVEEFSGVLYGGWYFQAVHQHTCARGRVHFFTFDSPADRVRAQERAAADCAFFNIHNPGVINDSLR